jgi:branched-subunit amino acid ABC-type transport system permease component
VLGAICIGLIERSTTAGMAHPGNRLDQLADFVLILILVFRPEGLLGERTPEGA